MSKKNTVWDISVMQHVLHKRVCFEEPVTEEEAIDLFIDGEYYDIMDVEMGEIEAVHGAEMVGNPDEDEDEDEGEYDEH
jgi:hypothetical protein